MTVGSALKDTEDVLMQVMAPMEKHLSGVVFRDAYCIGFLQTVAIHTATESLKQHSNESVPAEKAMAVFEQALNAIAPAHAAEAAEQLPFLRAGTSSHNEAYNSGRKDGDLYMRYRLLHLGPEGAGKAALERFFDNVRRISSPASLRPTD
jgi:sigma54-dependent transcription regulator